MKGNIRKYVCLNPPVNISPLKVQWNLPSLNELLKDDLKQTELELSDWIDELELPG